MVNKYKITSDAQKHVVSDILKGKTESIETCGNDWKGSPNKFKKKEIAGPIPSLEFFVQNTFPRSKSEYACSFKCTKFDIGNGESL